MNGKSWDDEGPWGSQFDKGLFKQAENEYKKVIVKESKKAEQVHYGQN